MKTISEVAKELGIDVPIMASKIVGEKMILYLYGGRIVEYKLPKAEGKDDNRKDAKNAESNKGAEKKLAVNSFQKMKLNELRKIASSHGIKIHGKAKVDLIDDLEHAFDLIEEV